MSRFASILGQPRVLELLERFLETERIPHALLFHGPEGVGKTTTATAFAEGMLGRSGHPDLFKVGRLPKKASAGRAGDAAPVDESSGDLRSRILVSQIRELSHMAALAPREGCRRVFFIDPADRMNLEAQNALLKTLEEPPGQAVLILIASRPHLLLPTVRSRCFNLGFSAVRSAELTRLLVERGMDPTEAGARAALAGGRPGRALALDLAELREQREGMLRILEALSEGPAAVAEMPAMASALAGKDEGTLLDGLDLLQGLLRDAARSDIAGSDGALLHADLSPRLAQVGRRMGSLRASDLAGRIETLRGYLRFNTNRNLIAESVLAAVAGGPSPA